MREVFVTGLHNVLRSLPPPRRIVYVSSTGVYGQQDGGEVDESSPTEPAEESGQVVRAVEQVLAERLPGAVILRFAGIYGPERVIRRAAVAAGEPITGDPDKWLNLIHVDDGAAAVLAAEARAQPGRVYNVCDDQPVRRRDFYTRLAELLGAPEPRFVLPEPGAPPPPHERANRRVLNRRLRTDLGLALRYPSYVEGLRSALGGG
jgi:nucleoside-diphosphate-sugar epimerase